MVIDFHTHIFPNKIARATIGALSKNASIPSHSDGTLDGLINQMNDGGVSIAINLPVVTKPTQFDTILEFGKSINQREYDGSRVISFGGIHPDCENIEEKLYKIKAEGFLGVKLHPDYQGEYIDNDTYVHILKCCKSLDLIVVTHAGLDGAFINEPIKCTPERVLRVLDKIGGYEKLVLAHMGGNELFSEVYGALAGENVYFDTSYVLHSIGRDMFEKILARHGENKILFATDSPWQSISQEIGIIKSYGLGERIENKIFYKNAKKLLNI